MPQTFDEFLDASEAADATTPEATETVETPEVPAPDVGQGSAEGTPTPEGSAPTGSADRYKVKVGGEEREVTLDEALAGYMRQSDYTRKTQDAAAALGLWESLNSNPADTIRDLALRQLAAQQKAPEPLDPVQAELQALRREVDQVQQFNSDQALARQLGQLKHELGDDFNIEEVATRAYEFAQRTGVPPDLRATFFQIQGEKLFAQAAAQKQLASEDAAGDAAAQAAKAAAGQLFGGRTGNGGGAPIEASEELTLAEIVRRAVDGDLD